MPQTRSQSLQGGVVESGPEQLRRNLEEDITEATSQGSSNSSDEEEVERPAAEMANVAQRARFQYKTFHGKSKEDPDEWLEDFMGTAQANGEYGIKLTTLAGVLRGEARPWFNSLPPQIRNDWDAFRVAFLQEFRKVGEESEALIRIGQMRMKSKESVRRFLQRFNRLAKKIDPAPANSMLMSWFVSALPKKMGVSVRQSHPTTLDEAVEAAQSYRSADISSSKIRKKKKKYDTPSSSESSSEESSSEEDISDSDSESSSSSSESEKETRRKKRKTKKKKKKVSSKEEKGLKKMATTKLKVEALGPAKEKGVDGRMEEITNQLKALTVHFAGLQPNRRKVPINRAHVWCVKCRQYGHLPQECPIWPEQVHYVGEEGMDQSMAYPGLAISGGGYAGGPVDYFYEEAPDPVYQISAGPRTLLGRPAPPMGVPYGVAPWARHMDQSNQQGMMGDRTRIVICWNCGKPGHYSTSCPEPRRQANGAIPLLCALCKKEGHVTANCPVGAAPRNLMARPDGGPAPTAAQAPGETGVNYLSMEWQNEGELNPSSGWQYGEEMAGMETPLEEDHCYKVSTRAAKKKERQDEKVKNKKVRKERSEIEVVPPENDSDYRRDHPRLFYPKVNEEIKKQLEEMEALEHKKAIEEDIRLAKLRELEEITAQVKREALRLQEEAAKMKEDQEKKASQKDLVSYDIAKEVKSCPVTTTVGQLLKDNPMYRKQLKEMLVGRRRRRLPKVGTAADVMMIYEDQGAPEIDIQISGCVLSYVPIDGGSGVNIMIEETAQQLGFKSLQPTARTMRLANGARVVPVGTLLKVPTLIGGTEFSLNYLVMRPTRPSTYPVLIGRPWLYGAKVTTDWGKKEFRFGKPATVVSWGGDKHQGETTTKSEEYDSEVTTDLDSDEDEVYMLEMMSTITEEEVFGEEVIQHLNAGAAEEGVTDQEEGKLDGLKERKWDGPASKETSRREKEVTPEAGKVEPERGRSRHEQEVSDSNLRQVQPVVKEAMAKIEPGKQGLKRGAHRPEKGKSAHERDKYVKIEALKALEKKEEDSWQGGLRLAQLEQTLDPTLRNRMEVIQEEQFRKVGIPGGKEFNIGYSLDPSMEGSMQKLLGEYADVFAWSHLDLTGVNPTLGEHRIDLMLGAPPVRQRQYRMNPKYSLMVKEEIDKLVEAGFIYPVLNSEWVSPIVIVPKKPGPDGQAKIRVCQDYRKLNDATKKDHYPIPFTDMVLDMVAGWEVYSFLDGYSGYNQIWIKKEDQLKTAFTTEWGVFAFRRMPFGLCNAPGMFQRLMMNIFHDFLRKFLEVFIDDFAVFGRRVEHVEHLRLTFQRCREVGLKLHPQKCYFGVEEGLLLGHRVSKEGIKVDQDKVAVWMKVKFPTTISEARGFLGCVNYYRRFVKDFAKVALPLTSMLKNGADFEPTPERLTSFEALKQGLLEAPILRSPDWKKVFQVYVDVSGFCIGVVLSQLDEEGRDHPIYFASRLLAAAERNYSPTDREALGIIYACKKFRHYLLGYKVVFHTDHNALKHMVNKVDLTGRIARWVLLLQEFDYEVKVRPGRRHGNADFFSRIAGEINEKVVDDRFPDEDLLQVRTAEDTWYPDILLFLQTASLPAGMSKEGAAVFLRKVRPYLLIRGVLHKEGVDSRIRRCLERKEAMVVMRALHEEEAGGHYAEATTSRKILDAGYWWPTLHKDVHQFVRSCDPCQRIGKPARTSHHPLTSILPLAPFEKWGVDFIGPITPVTRGRRNRYIILATDYATKWVEARATPKNDASTAARFLYEQIFTRFGPPLELVSDRGTHFVNEMVEQLTNQYLVKHRKTTPYHPKANGLTERVNGIIGKILNKTVAVHKTDWDLKLFSAVYSYNLAYKTTTGHSPYFLVYGQYALVPVEFEVPTMRVSMEDRLREDQSLMERARQLELLEETREEASKRLRHQQELTKRQHDKRLKLVSLKDGDLVLMYDSRHQHFPGKLHTRWLGPYLVKAMHANGSVELETLEGQVFPVWVHYDRLKKYHFFE